MSQDALKREFDRAIAEFKHGSGLSREQLDQFQFSSFDDLLQTMGGIQRKHAQDKRWRYMRRLDPFLKSMKEYEKVIEVFLNASDILAFVWITSSVVDAFDAFLNVYQESLPLLSSYKSLFSDNSHMQTLLVTIFKDILAIHKEAVIFLKKKYASTPLLFQGVWKGFEVCVKELKRAFSQHRHLIENRASLIEFEEVQRIRQLTEDALAQAAQANVDRQHRFLGRDTSVIAVLGRKILLQANGSLTMTDSKGGLTRITVLLPLLWLNGKPGAGKSVLASVVADQNRAIPDVSVGLFYCVQSDPQSNTFISVAKSFLAQMLTQDTTLLPLVYENMRTENGEAVLKKTDNTKMLLDLALRCRKTYLIIDGIDECERDERKKICSWFSNIVDSLGRTQADEIRCIFVSQDDGIARKDLSGLSAISITTENTERDIHIYSTEWQAKIEQKFGTFQEYELNIAKVVTAKSQGMFIYAKCVLPELYHQASREQLLSHWRSDHFPNDLNEVYLRILQRIKEGLPTATIETIEQLLGWICCAKRPLEWYEIQVAASVDLHSDHVVAEGDDWIFVHHSSKYIPTKQSSLYTAPFLKNDNIFCISEAEKSLTLISIAYLCTELIDREVDEAVLEAALLAGSYGFLEYTSVCWVPHLLSWLQDSPTDEDMLDLAESLEAVLDSHFLEQEQNIMVPQKPLKALSPLEDFDIYTSIAQVVVWMRKQIMGFHCGSEAEDLLDFPQVISKFRSSLEMYFFLNDEDAAQASLGKLYGNNWFKCPRMSCRYFHHGFANRDLRDQHIARHERAYLCTIEGCITATLGCATRAELQKHMLESHGIIGEEDSFRSMPNPDRTQGPKLHCPKSFTRPANLQSHERSHRNERPFACDTCGMTFVRQHDKKRHEETRHAGERRFICYGYLRNGSAWGCQKTFVRADVLNDHHKSQSGRSCIRALLEEKKAEMGDIPEDEILAQIARFEPTHKRVDTLATLRSSTSLGSEDDEFAELDLERSDTFQPESVESSSQKRGPDDSGSEELAELHRAKRFQFKSSYIRHSATQRRGDNSSSD
ncbi:hypothetical protein PG994_006000 [Apiospora phragmitis]|uniref:C2H2-type domain-containing protein n=1 Tax=Apiospora phragmitis TaxID=2905665 RepID=A0ABR1VDU1_9PEZI